MYPTRSEFVNNLQAVRIAELEMQLNHLSLGRDHLLTGANRNPHLMAAHPIGPPFIMGHPMGGHVMVGHPMGGHMMVGPMMGRPPVGFMVGGPNFVPIGFHGGFIVHR